MRWISPLSIVGVLFGTLFFAFSLTPSLLPRPFAMQGLIAGLSFTAGYALGVFGQWLWYYLELPGPRLRTARVISIVAGSGCVLVMLLFMWRASEWQMAVRELMGIEETVTVQPLGVVAIAALVFVAMLIVARLFRATFRFLSRKLQRIVPRRISYAVWVMAALALFWALIDGVVFTVALQVADSSYQQVDALIEDDLERPLSPKKTGSPDSLVEWRDLGRQGRNYIATGPSVANLSEFFGDDTVLEPIRVYIGLNAAETAEERAALALAELQRVNAFERSVLLLVTPTGTGWVDPAAAIPIEYLHRGDIATVAAQYSYLPSPLSLWVESDYGVETARALFEVIYGYWTELPADERPALYLHGLSLGALNSDRSFDFYDIIHDPFQGALWSGPPFRSETWQRITQRRDRGSPAWLPIFRDGHVVRFMNQEHGFERPDAPWGPFRIGFLQYASDPVTFFEPEAFFREPAWMSGQRAPDVAPDLRWYPIVTMLQLAADMTAGTTPAGYGHNYAVEHYIDAWHALTEPPGWSEAEIERLKVWLSGIEEE
ncbi:hypothetical protein CKO15_09040 [Halorhodospira abdelmalekii]|uniref:alpha/beta hydrolase n=1 Tax=Halorhodospira abdelmalekii TaxID=421629 RepID=UPI0019037204|nr:alpha/beta-hydrolase family protein [Halorhodospira abdelmalekii]MBK1735424.1 hypothetical protein [Halorhodospira abdelmalekii]